MIMLHQKQTVSDGGRREEEEAPEGIEFARPERAAPKGIELARPEGAVRGEEPEGIAASRPEGSMGEMREGDNTSPRRSKSVAGKATQEQRSASREGPRVVSDITLDRGATVTLERCTDREGKIIIRQRLRDGSTSSMDGTQNTPTETPKSRRKCIKEPLNGSGESTPGTPAPGTPVLGKKRKKKESPPKGLEEGETALAKIRPALRGPKTPRTSDAESAAEGGELPPPLPSTSSSYDFYTDAPGGSRDHTKKPTVIDTIVVSDSSETMDSGAERRQEDGEEENNSSTSLDSQKSLNIGENARRHLRSWKGENIKARKTSHNGRVCWIRGGQDRGNEQSDLGNERHVRRKGHE